MRWLTFTGGKKPPEIIMKTSVFTLHLCNIPAQPIHLVWDVLHSYGVCWTMTNVSCPFTQNNRCIHAAAFKIKHREMQLQQTGTHMRACTLALFTLATFPCGSTVIISWYSAEIVCLDPGVGLIAHTRKKQEIVSLHGVFVQCNT